MSSSRARSLTWIAVLATLSRGVADETHWAYRPIPTVAPPRPSDSGRVRTPIDAFILRRLEKAGVRPSPEADRRTLIRRVTYDLIGLPPQPREVDAFVSDPSPDAYERLVERLLASPRHGERWARHWMDVVHFAETHGHDQDRPRENAWPYRDYLVSAFNADTPYGRFIEEQLAGDVLFPGDPRGTIATGFIAAGPWDESSLRDIQAGTLDNLAAQYLDRDDMVTTTMATFTSTTVHCARCHRHKFDPISQRDYYGLQAVFAGVDRANRPYDVDASTRSQRRELEAEAKLLEENRVPRETLLSPRTAAEVTRWERANGERLASWRVLDATSFVSAGGAIPVEQPDRSILFTGPRSDKDTYTIVAPTGLESITAVRVEALSDPSLPSRGPGRADNGNFHLHGIRVFAAPAAEPSRKTELALVKPSADFDQAGWDVTKALDGNPKTGWAIYPRVGRAHQAVFQVEGSGIEGAPPFPGGMMLTFVLEQLQGGHHLIGRPRLSATDTPRPVRASTIPDAVGRLLARPPAVRSDDERAALARHVLAQRNRERLAALPGRGVVFAAATDFKPEGAFRPAKTPRAVHVLRRGDIERPGKAVVPGALSVIDGLPSRFELDDPSDEGSRRAALARWISDRRNPLTWRSIVNRIWHYHFGRGLVDTLNDFGHMGGQPSHPELLDWLAARFRDGGGSLKALHRLMVTSAVYRQSSAGREDAERIDASNRLLWRMPRRRLSAECVRDAMLGASGKLDLSMGGPSVRQFVESKGVHVTPVVDYAGFDVDSAASFRRSTYRFLFRTLPDPFLATLDCADGSQLTPVRTESVTALQALALLNNRFVVRQAEHLANRVEAERAGIEPRITAAFRHAVSRRPTREELDVVGDIARRHGLANACRLILNLNEFVHVD